MSGFAWIVLPLLVGLGASHDPSAAREVAEASLDRRYLLRPDDSEVALVQTGVTTARWGWGKLDKNYNASAAGFNVSLDGGFHYVASVAVSVSFAGVTVHAYDIALYLRSSSPVWKTAKSANSAAMIQDMMGDSQIHLHFTTKWVSRSAMARFVDFLEPFMKKAGAKNYTKALVEYKRKLLHGPQVTIGSSFVIEPRSDGIQIWVNRKDLGKVVHDTLGAITMQSYFGPEPVLPTFRKGVLKQLQTGLDDAVDTKPAEEMVRFHHPWYYWLIIVVIILGMAVSTFGTLWFCCLRSFVAAPKADAIARKTG